MVAIFDSTARVKKNAQNAKVLKLADIAAVMELVDIGVSKSPVGNGVRVRLPPAAPIEEGRAETLAYIVGVALGDGNLSRPNGRATRLRITCDAKYPVMAAEFVQNLKILFPSNKVSYVRRVSTYFDISVYSNKLDAWMPWLVGKGSKKDQHARVPEWIHGDSLLQKACLRGLIQTDGCIYKDRGYQMLNFTNNSSELALDAFRMLIDIGYRPTFITTLNVGVRKYTVRVARRNEIEQLIQSLNLYKA